jgi:hypothetical protein
VRYPATRPAGARGVGDARGAISRSYTPQHEQLGVLDREREEPAQVRQLASYFSKKAAHGAHSR